MRARIGRIAWIDVVVQLVVASALLALMWAVVTGGLVQRAVVSATDWYADAVVPQFGVGVGAVLPSAEFREGVFGSESLPPAAISSVAALAAP